MAEKEAKAKHIVIVVLGERSIIQMVEHSDLCRNMHKHVPPYRHHHHQHHHHNDIMLINAFFVSISFAGIIYHFN